MKIQVVCMGVSCFVKNAGAGIRGMFSEEDGRVSCTNQVSMHMRGEADGAFTFKVADAAELAKWVPGQEYELTIGQPGDDEFASMVMQTAVVNQLVADQLKAYPPAQVPADLDVDADE